MIKFPRITFITLTIFTVAALIASGLIGPFQTEVSAKGKPDTPPGQSKQKYTAEVQLEDIDSQFTSPTGQFRWLDVADQTYCDAYRNSYDYTQAKVEVAYAPVGEALEGVLKASKLKPNFAYQVKLGGDPIAYSEANDKIGLAGRWWRETWNGSEWIGGKNSSDSDYLAHKDDLDLIGGSPTELMYKFTGYMVFDYFITDSRGNASLSFKVNSSYHVLFKTTQREPLSGDGPVKTVKFKVNAKLSEAYDTNYDHATVSIYGQVERPPVGGIYLAPCSYNCQFFLTEESFHGNGITYAGNWAAAMGAPISFEIAAP